MNARKMFALATLCCSVLLGACATAPGAGDRWLERMNILRAESSAGSRTICMEFGQFRLDPAETVVSQTNSELTVRGPRGEFTIHHDPLGKEFPTAETLANRDMLGSFYHANGAGQGYVATLAHPLQDMEIPIAWIEGPMLTGGSADAGIYSRYFPAGLEGQCPTQ
jgi:hypothetical protein